MKSHEFPSDIGTVRPKLLGLAVAAALGNAQPLHAATITVDTTTDSPNIITASACTLRFAVMAANQNTAVGRCDAGDPSGVDEIVFQPDLGRGTVTLEQGQITIASSLTIDGQTDFGPITISANRASRIFRIDDGDDDAVSTVTLRNLTLRDGLVRGNARGGAVSIDHETVTIESSALVGNSALAGSSHGGGIDNGGGNLSLIASTVSGNSAESFGGGIWSDAGLLLLNDTVIEDNVASFAGGVVHFLGNGPGEVLIENSMLVGNTATEGDGGALWTNSTISITDSTLDGNNAAARGGAVFASTSPTDTSKILSNVVVSNNTANEGGGVWTDAFTTVINDSTFSSNIASRGGAIATGTSFGPLALISSSLSGNSAANGAALDSQFERVSITNSVLSGNIGNNTVRFRGDVSARLELLRTTISANSGTSIIADRDVSVANSTIANNTGSPWIVFNLNAETSIENSTIWGNTEGGLAMRRGEIVNSTIINNRTGIDIGATLALTNSVIAQSVIEDCNDGAVTLTANTNNHIEDGSCAAGGFDFQSGDPMLGPLQDNGGLTFTHAPLPGSPLVDAANNVDCPDTDQTGMPRSIDGNADGDADCDIGSIEFVDLFPPIATLTEAPDVTDEGDASFDVIINYLDADGAVDIASPDVADIQILPGPLSVERVRITGNPQQLSVIYTVTPPGGEWDAVDNGDYTITINADEVFDTATTGVNAVPAGLLGGFTVAIAEIDVTGNGVSITDGDNTPSQIDATDFGTVLAGSSRDAIFAIINSGVGTVDLTDPIEALGADFSVDQPALTSLTAGESTTFTVTFAPTSVGVVTGLVTIPNTDGNENPYTFAISGVGTDQPPPEQIFADGFEG